MNTIITRFWLVGAVAGAIVAAMVFPKGAGPLTDYFVVDGGVVVVMFLGSLKLSANNFKKALSRVDLVLGSVGAVFVVSPALSLLLARVLGFHAPEDSAAILICSAQASTLATAVVLTEVAGGNVALAMVITVANNLATVLLTPLVFRLALQAEVEVDALCMGREMALKLLLPVLVAQAARRWIGDWAVRWKRRLSVTSQLIILIYIYCGVAAATELTGPKTLFIRLAVLVVTLHMAMLMFNALWSRFLAKDPETRAAVVLTSSQKTLPAAMLVWKSCFGGLALGPVAAVMHHVFQLVVDSILAPRFLRLPLIRNRDTHETIDKN